MTQDHDRDALAGDIASPVDARDREALNKWIEGDSRAGDRLIMRHFPSIRAYFHRRAPEEHEDLVSETFLQLSASKQSFRGECSVRVFIYAIARNVLRQHLRRRGRLPDFDPYTTSLGEAWGKRPSSALVEREEHAALLDALQDIPSEAQDLLELRYWRGLTGPELRDLFEIPEGTVRSRLRTALQRLREKYEEISARGLSEANAELWLREVRPK